MAEKKRRGWRIFATVLMGIGCAVAIVTGIRIAADFHYEGRALPGTQVAGIDVSGMTQAQIADVLSRRVAGMEVSFDYQGTTQTVPAADAGLQVDIAGAAEKALQAKRDAGLSTKYSAAATQDVAITSTVDTDTLQSCLNSVFSDVTTEPVNAAVASDAQMVGFTVQPSAEGQEIDASHTDTELLEQAAKLSAITVPVSVQPIAPEVSSSQAQAVADQLNANLDQDYTLTLGDKKLETLDRDTVASWIHISDDGLTPTADEQAIAQYLTDQVAPEAHKDPVEQVKVVSKSTGAFMKYQTKGVNGRDVADVPALAASIGKAILDGSPTTIDVPVAEVPFTEKTVVAPDKLIVVDLASQTATLYEDNNQVASYLISSGKAGTATPKGTFYVRAHVRLQTMRGNNLDGTRYETPNVEWVTYFNGGIAFHATYWHSNFGHPMSHGCINMTYDAAKFVYNWTDIGTTKVVVQ